MTAEYFLGGALVLMGAAQIWLRWGPWGKEQQQAEKELTERRAEAATEAADGSAVLRGSKLWNKWTAILGPLGIAFGVALIIWGALGGQ